MFLGRVQGENAMILKGANEWQFKTVDCRAYMKKIRDGRFISGNDKDGYSYVEADGEGNYKERDIPDEDWGCKEFLKTLYQRTEKQFRGVVVGMKMLTITEYLVIDTDYVPPFSEERTFITKHPEDVAKCLLVYFGVNKSRYVPIGDAKIVED